LTFRNLFQKLRKQYRGTMTKRNEQHVEAHQQSPARFEAVPGVCVRQFLVCVCEGTEVSERRDVGRGKNVPSILQEVGVHAVHVPHLLVEDAIARVAEGGQVEEVLG
jgi:hypothetical protein